MTPVIQPTDEEIASQIEAGTFVESDGEPMETNWHRHCMNLLIASILHWWRDRDDFYVSGNSFIYFSLQQARDRDYRGPDFYIVNGGVQLRPERKYWVTWLENDRFPDVIVELASPTTEREDRTTKFRIYEKTFHTRNYFIYDPLSQQLDGWELDDEGRYRPLTPNEHGWLWCAELDLWIGTWEGEYLRNLGTWLRFYDKEGKVAITSEEAAKRLAERTQISATAAKRLASDQKRRADAAERQADEAKRQADEAKRQADEAKRQADNAKRQADDEKRRADEAVAELARLRALLSKPGDGNSSATPST